MNTDKTYQDEGVWLVYDGDCPLCRRSAQAVSLQENCGKLHLLNARDNRDHALMRDIHERGFDLDEGIVIYHDGRFYHGADALRFIAVHSTPQGIGNKIIRIMFRYRWSARIAYPVLRCFRTVLLKIIGVQKIGNTR